MSDENVNEQENAILEINAKEIEEQMIAAAEARAQDPIEMAASVLHMYAPYLKNAIPKLSTRGLRRLVNFLVFYPFEQDDVKPGSEFERDVMNLANQLVEAKFVMIMSTYTEAAKELYEASQKPLTEEEAKEIEKTLDNNTESEV